MGDIFDTLLKPFRALFEWFLSFLAQLNIEPSMSVVQGVALVTMLGATWYAYQHRKSLKPDDGTRNWWTIGVGAALLIPVGVLTDWTVQRVFPLPDRVDGVITVQGAPANSDQILFDTHAELLDYRGHRIPSSSGKPETATGNFEITFKPEFSNPPRKIIVVSAHADTIARPLSRRDIRSGVRLPFELVPR